MDVCVYASVCDDEGVDGMDGDGDNGYDNEDRYHKNIPGEYDDSDLEYGDIDGGDIEYGDMMMVMLNMMI
ncbi:hypothetical protein Btru_019814 [Bulinus truncatus]|nr:hypothetical protein Btru_019814 [Bulinus truncatus]